MTIFNRTISAIQIAIIGVSLLIIMIMLQGIFFYKQYSKAEESRTWVAHTYEVLNAIRTPFAKIKDAQIAQRGYLITGNENFLEPYYAAIGNKKAGNAINRMGYLDINSFDENIAALRVLIKDNPVQLQSLTRLDLLLKEEMEFITNSIETYKTSPDKAIAMVRSGYGQDLMNEVRAIITEMMDRERNLLAERLQKDKIVESAFTWSIIISALITYTGLLAAIIIITKYFGRMRRAEQELKTKEAYFRAAAECGIDAFFIFYAVHDAQDKIIDLRLQYMNLVAEDMLDLHASKLLHKTLEEVITYSDLTKTETRSEYLEVLSSGHVRETEYSITTGLMAGKSYQEQVVPLPDGIAISCRDITDRKTMERLKNEFVSMVSHELRTPLTSIRASLGLVLGENPESLPNDAKELLTIAHNNCERLVRLINDILDIEKIESGKMVFDLRPHQLMFLVRQAVDSTRSFAEKYSTTLVIESSGIADDLKIQTDADRFIQVMTNLLSNASKFSSPNEPVRTVCKLENGFVRIAVIDKGRGIPEKFRSHIFQKFAQADSSDSRQKGGTGLGLSIVKAMVEEMGGQIGFESEPGKGTEFYFTVPIAAQVISDTKKSNLITSSTQRILVCEDDEDVANLLKLILERAGFSVTIAADATYAQQLLQENTYLAMTLDLMLPDKSGITLIHELRNNPNLVNLPIIVVSAKAEEGRKELNGDAINIVDWMHKPIDVDKLIKLVHGLGLARRPHILHVEDDIDMTKVLGKVLNKAADVISAPSLKDARSLLNSEIFDLVILDVGLPDGSGLELLPLLGSEGNHPTPVILFTAAEVSKEVSEKVAASLTKSRTSEESLLETIRQLITHHNHS